MARKRILIHAEVEVDNIVEYKWVQFQYFQGSNPAYFKSDPDGYWKLH